MVEKILHAECSECSEAGLPSRIAMTIVAAKARHKNGLMSRKA